MTTHDLGRRASQRRQYYIKGSFQRRVIVQVCALVIGGCGLFAVTLYVYGTRTLTTAFVDSKLRVMSTAEFLLPALGLVTLVVASLVAIAAAVRMLLLSHRIAGPLYRLEKTAEAIGEGQLDLQVSFRSGDQLQELARSMNAMMRELRTHVQEIQTQTQQLRELILQARQRGTMPPELLEALQDTQGRLDEAVGRFRF